MEVCHNKLKMNIINFITTAASLGDQQESTCNAGGPSSIPGLEKNRERKAGERKAAYTSILGLPW